MWQCKLGFFCPSIRFRHKQGKALLVRASFDGREGLISYKFYIKSGKDLRCIYVINEQHVQIIQLEEFIALVYKQKLEA